jgi:hypothetical protein
MKGMKTFILRLSLRLRTLDLTLSLSIEQERDSRTVISWRGERDSDRYRSERMVKNLEPESLVEEAYLQSGIRVLSWLSTQYHRVIRIEHPFRAVGVITNRQGG